MDLLAGESVLGHVALDQVVLDGPHDALVGTATVRGVVPALDGDEDAGVELFGQALRHRVGSGGVVRGADDEDGGGTGRVNGLTVGVLGRPGGQAGGGVADVAAQDRQFALESLHLCGPLLDVSFGRVVQVVDRVDRVRGVVRVGAVGVARVHEVSDREHRGAVVSARGVRIGVGELGPPLGVVHGPGQRGDGQIFGERARRVVRAHRAFLEGVEEGTHGLDALLEVASHRAGGLGGAVGDPVLERGVEASHLQGRDLVDAEGGVEGAIKHEAADALREEPGVGGPQEGAVGVSEEVERVLAEDGAHHVEVAGSAHGVDVLIQAARVFAAPRGDL